MDIIAVISGSKNMVEKFFKYLKNRAIIFYHKISAKDYIHRIRNKTIPKSFHDMLLRRSVKMPIKAPSFFSKKSL
jgi:hypothetical protein